MSYRLPLLVLALALSALPARAQIDVVASFSILADMTREIGGEDVRVTALVGPDTDGHAYSPNPADAQTLAKARVVVVNGLGFEGWLDRLVRASGFKGPVVVATDGITPLTMESGHTHGGHSHAGHSHGSAGTRKPAAKRAADPHAWHDLARAQTYAANIAAGLAAADPAHAEGYRRRADTYRATLAQLDGEIRAAIDAVPKARRKILTAHDAFGYYGAAYGVTFLSPVGLSTEEQPSAKAVASLIRQMKRENIRTVFAENMSDRRLVQQISQEAGGRIGGTLYADALSKSDGPASSLVAMMRHNTALLVGAMTEKN
jgi:zinc/manganese transport system substrate-binding protein